MELSASLADPAAPHAPLSGVALITGGARRIGAAISETLHAAGMRVVVHHRQSAEAAQALVAKLNAQRADSALALSADLMQAAEIERLVTQAQAHWGRLDALINNASAYYRTPFGSIVEAQFDELIGSNFKAPLFLAQAVWPHFAAGGVIVNIIDSLARSARPGFAPYNAAKAALWALTETLAVEMAPQVRVNGVAPGHVIWTEDWAVDQLDREAELARIPLRRLASAGEIADAVHFLLTPAAAFMTGAVLPVDGGLRLRTA